MTPPLMFLFGKIKTVANKSYSHFVFMYLRPSSTGLQDTPLAKKQKSRNKMKYKDAYIGCDILHKDHYILYMNRKSRGETLFQ